MKIKKKGLKVLLIILGVFILIGISFFVYLSVGQDIKDVAIQNIDISKVPDGVYEGELTGSRFGNKLEVTVSKGRVADIRILKDMVISIPDISTKIFDSVMSEQTLRVDAVSGATVTSKAYLKSLEDALSGK